MTVSPDIIESFPKTHVLVVGDIMLDTFVYGDVTRLSPEGPVPVLAASREDTMPGGAGNAVANLCALGVEVSVAGLVGDDAQGRFLRSLLERLGADCSGIVNDPSRPTTLKTRFVAKGQQMMRVDSEKTHPLSEDAAEALLKAMAPALEKAGAVILSDYAKGCLTPTIIRAIMDKARTRGIPVLVDPKGVDYSLYTGADVITPNKGELCLASGGMPAGTDSEIAEAAKKILNAHGIGATIVTRSEEGVSLIRRDAKIPPLHLPALAKEVIDVSGAGDTVIAVIAATLASGAGLDDAIILGNLAAAIAVGKAGTAIVRSQELKEAMQNPDALKTTEDPLQAAIPDWDSAVDQVKRWKAKGLKVGFTNGCFDILHYGHVNYLNQARRRCDKLILGLNHDASVRILKGPTRPVNDETARATVIGALASIDLVVLFGAREAGEDNTPCALIGALQPDIFFKGGDYTIDKLPEAKIVQSYGGEVAIMPLYEGYSTTGTIQKMKEDKAA